MTSATPTPISGPPPAAASRSLGERIVSAGLAIAVAHALAKVLGLIQARTIGHYYGVNTLESDAFWFVFDGVLTTVFLVGEESLAPAYLPVFKAARDEESEARAWRITSTLLDLQFILLCVATAVLMLFPENVVAWLSRFDEATADAAGGLARAELAAKFLRAMAPAILGLSLGSMTYTVLVSYKRFFWPAFAEAALKAALVIGVVVGNEMGLRHEALVAGVLAAGATKIAVHFLAIGKKLRYWRPVLALRDPRVWQFFVLLAPLLVGTLFAKVRDWYNYQYLLSGDPGLLSVNKYARQTYAALGWLAPYPLAIAMLPFFCDLVAKNDRKAMGDFLTRATRMLLLVFVPLAAVLGVLSVPLAQALYQTGKVTAEDAAMVGRANACYTAVLPFYSLELIFMQAYFSERRTLAVTVIGIITSALSMVASYLGVIYYGLTGLAAVMVVALSFSGSKALKSLILAAILKREGLPFLPLGATFSFLARTVVLAAACLAVAYGSLRVVERKFPAAGAPAAEQAREAAAQPAAAAAGPAGEAPAQLAAAATASGVPAAPKEAATAGSGLKALLRALPKLVLPGLAALVVFYLGCKLLRLGELDEMIAFAKEKIRRKAKPSVPTPAAEG